MKKIKIFWDKDNLIPKLQISQFKAFLLNFIKYKNTTPFGANSASCPIAVYMRQFDPTVNIGIKFIYQNTHPIVFLKMPLWAESFSRFSTQRGSTTAQECWDYLTTIKEIL